MSNFNVQLDTADHFGDESFLAIDCTDNKTHSNQRKRSDEQTGPRQENTAKTHIQNVSLNPCQHGFRSPYELLMWEMQCYDCV